MGDAAALPSAVLNADCWSVDDRQLAAAAPGHTLIVQEVTGESTANQHHSR